MKQTSFLNNYDEEKKMIGILLISHGNFSQGIKQSAEMIMGEQQALASICWKEQEVIETLEKNIATKIKELDSGQGVLIMVDLLGASPYNASVVCSHKLENKHKSKVLTGMNLPMVIESLNDRMQKNCTLDNLYPEVLKSGINGIHEAMSFIMQNDK